LINQLKDVDYNSLSEIRHLLIPGNKIGTGSWIDLSGLLAPATEIENLIKSIENKEIDLTGIELQLWKIHAQYDQSAWSWVSHNLNEYLGKNINEVDLNDLISLIERWKTSVFKLDQLIYSDAKKEFNQTSKTAYGVDGNDVQADQDFESVRGNFESDTFVKEIANHIKTETETAENLIHKLSKFKQ